MTVYVDNMRRQATVGRVTARWSHLTADTREELLTFARAIGLRPEWRQAWDTRRFHFDVTDQRRRAAIAHGAEEISYPRGMAALLDRRRQAEEAAAAAAVEPSLFDSPGP